MGFIYSRHKQAIEDTNGEVIMTCDINPTKDAEFTNYRQMFESKVFLKNVDCVVICAPNHLHAEMVRDALRTGKKVLCEKPLCINTDFSFMEGVSVVQQLHYHPLFSEIQEKIKRAKHVKCVLRAYRDNDYYKTWKGDEIKSGGVLYTLGAHIFDLLVTTLGKDHKVLDTHDTMRKSTGIIMFGDVKVEFLLEFLDSRTGQTRHLEIDGEIYQLSIKDNLSFEGLHHKVYKAMNDGKGIGLADIIPSIQLMNEIKCGCR